MHCFFKRILQADVLPDGLMMLHDRILRKEIVTFAFVLSSTQKILNRAEATFSCTQHTPAVEKANLSTTTKNEFKATKK